MLVLAGLGFCLVVRIVLEILDMCESHSCACRCRVIAICCTGLGRCLYVSACGGSSSKDTSCAISARVFKLNVLVLLMTIRIILMSACIVPWVWRAFFNGSYMLWIWSMMSVIFPSVEYLHSMSCSCLLPRYVWSISSFPSGPNLKPIALIMYGL